MPPARAPDRGSVENIWEMINGPVADRIDALNRATLANTMHALVLSLLARSTEMGPPIPDEAALRRLHVAATQFLLARPGRYRTVAVHTEEDGAVIFRGQPHREIPQLIRQFLSELHALWPIGDALDLAALCVWRINWIHPFVNGNGRTGIAFAYACLCLKLGAALPRHEIFIEGVTAERAFLLGMRVANRSVAVPGGQPDLGPLKQYLDTVLLRQVEAARAGTGDDAARHGASVP